MCISQSEHQRAALVAVHIGIGTNDDFIEPEIIEIEGGQLLSLIHI